MLKDLGSTESFCSARPAVTDKGSTSYEGRKLGRMTLGLREHGWGIRRIDLYDVSAPSLSKQTIKPSLSTTLLPGGAGARG